MPQHVANIVKTATPPGGHVFQKSRPIFKFFQDLKTVPTKKTAQTPGGHVCGRTITKNKIDKAMIRNTGNLLIKFHEEWAMNVISIEFKRKNDPLPGRHVFQKTGTIFQLIQDIITINVLTKIHED
ncbi:hypothetical protein DPMN_131933 [Dreissena polymorpha]|uniref:Uncharacterized protein n=1 Tax=Dreissena polymorpha TaxID=45954 RepID=A0A9D4FSD0_DREPO|nr:hypothetical protein DPMN_131933 [Dreissena polymorpha]